jgi:hypothetical protein
MAMVRYLVGSREALGRTLRAAFKKGEADGDQASMDMLIGRTEVTDKAG